MKVFNKRVYCHVQIILYCKYIYRQTDRKSGTEKNGYQLERNICDADGLAKDARWDF